MIDALKASLAASTLLEDRGELYVAAGDTLGPVEVWTHNGAWVAQFIYRKDAEAFVAIVNLIQKPVAGSGN